MEKECSKRKISKFEDPSEDELRTKRSEANSRERKRTEVKITYFYSFFLGIK